jgi:membrane protein DedA with SNARE-associated domain
MVNEILDWLLTTVQSVDPLTRNLLAGLAIMLETSLFVGLVIPGDTVVLVASTGVTDLSDFFFLLSCVLLGSLLGESFGFWIGRLFGERIRYSKLGNRIGEKNWKMADAFIESRGGLAVAISRFLPVLHSLVPVVAGASKMRYRVFIRWTIGACTVWASAYVGVGFLAQASYEQIGANLKYGALVFIAIILVFMTIVHFAKKRLEKSAIRMVEADKADQFTELEG